MHILKRAPRDYRGYVKNEPPVTLSPRVVKQLTVGEQVKLESIRLRQIEINVEMKKALESLGLNPHESYRFTKDGEVIVAGTWNARY